MATTLNNSMGSRRALAEALRTDARPYLMQKPHDGHPATNNQYPSLMRTHTGKRVEGITDQTSGLVFAFSRYPFTVTYRTESGEERIMEEVNAVTLPKGIEYSIRNCSELNLNSTSNRAGGVTGETISLPVGYTIGHINRHLAEGRMVVKMAVPAHMFGEAVAHGGEVVEENNEKHIIIGPQNQEFSAAGSKSPQDFHVHMGLVETYTSYGGMLLYYVYRGKLEAMEVRPGETLVVPPNVIHIAEIYDTEPTFVTMSGMRSIREDKFVIPMVKEYNGGQGLMEAVLRVQ
jgi:mannose-6-phosphate isomerase-like protein (cupin superfamily)